LRLSAVPLRTISVRMVPRSLVDVMVDPALRVTFNVGDDD